MTDIFSDLKSSVEDFVDAKTMTLSEMATLSSTNECYFIPKNIMAVEFPSQVRKRLVKCGVPDDKLDEFDSQLATLIQKFTNFISEFRKILHEEENPFKNESLDDDNKRVFLETVFKFDYKKIKVYSDQLTPLQNITTQVYEQKNNIDYVFRILHDDIWCTIYNLKQYSDVAKLKVEFQTTFDKFVDNVSLLFRNPQPVIPDTVQTLFDNKTTESLNLVGTLCYKGTKPGDSRYKTFTDNFWIALEPTNSMAYVIENSGSRDSKNNYLDIGKLTAYQLTKNINLVNLSMVSEVKRVMKEIRENKAFDLNYFHVKSQQYNDFSSTSDRGRKQQKEHSEIYTEYIQKKKDTSVSDIIAFQKLHKETLDKILKSEFKPPFIECKGGFVWSFMTREEYLDDELSFSFSISDNENKVIRKSDYGPDTFLLSIMTDLGYDGWIHGQFPNFEPEIAIGKDTEKFLERVGTLNIRTIVDLY